MPKPAGWYCNDSQFRKTINDCYTIIPLAIGDALNDNLNGFTYFIPGLPTSDVDWKNLMAGWWAAVSSAVLPAMSGGKIIGGFQMTDAKVKEGHKAIYALPIPVHGTITGGDLPDSSEVTTTYSTFEAERGGPGGLRWGPVPRSASDGNEITEDYRNLILAMMDRVAVQTITGIVCHLVKFDHCHGLVKPIVEFVINPIISNLDSRKPRVGE